MTVRIGVIAIVLCLASPVLNAASSFTNNLDNVFLGLDFVSVWQGRDSILATNSNDPLAYALVGRSWVEGTAPPNASEAIALCERGLALGGEEWKLAECHLGIAIAQWAQGDVAAARAACDRAAQISPNSRARREADLVRHCLDMTRATTPHLWVFAPPNSAVAQDLQAWANRREQAAQHTIQMLGVQPWRPIRIIVCDDQAQGQAVLGHSLGYTDRRMAAVYTRADQTPGHELTHALSLFLLPGRPWGGGPDREAGRGRLINEGLAVALDASGRDLHSEARQVLATLNSPPTFAQMDSENVSEGVLYPLAGSFIDWFGHTRGSQAIVQLWCHPGTNDEAALAACGATTEQLWAQWLAALPGL